MLTPSYLSGVSESVVEIYSQVENDILADIARRIIKTGVVTETAKWQIQKGIQFGAFNNNVVKAIAEATNKTEEEVTLLIKRAGVKALETDDSIYRKAGKNPLPLSKSDKLAAIVYQGTDSVMSLIGKYTKTTALDASNAFNNVLDRAYLQVISGAFTQNDAIKMAVRELSRNNMVKIAYPSGSEASLESSIRRAVLTGVNQTAAKLQIARAEEMECTLVEVSSHPGARPEHAVWQGKVFSLKGTDGKYEDFYEATGYGTGQGLCGWNCYHNFYPFFEGVSRKSFAKDPSKEDGSTNDRDYIRSQKQRYYERNIRAAKKESYILSESLKVATTKELKEHLEKELARANNTLSRRQGYLREFLKKNGGRRHYEREWTAGYNK